MSGAGERAVVVAECSVLGPAVMIALEADGWAVTTTDMEGAADTCAAVGPHALVQVAGPAAHGDEGPVEGVGQLVAVAELCRRSPLAPAAAGTDAGTTAGATHALRSIVLVAGAGSEPGAATGVDAAVITGGLVGLVQGLARELGPAAVTANLVVPGLVDDGHGSAVGFQDQEWVARLVRATPIRRLVTPQEVAATVSFLCSAAAAYVSGTVWPVSGGLGMGAR